MSDAAVASLPDGVSDQAMLNFLKKALAAQMSLSSSEGRQNAVVPRPSQQRLDVAARPVSIEGGGVSGRSSL